MELAIAFWMKFNNIAKLVVSLEFKERTFLILFIAITIPIAIDAYFGKVYGCLCRATELYIWNNIV